MINCLRHHKLRSYTLSACCWTVGWHCDCRCCCVTTNCARTRLMLCRFISCKNKKRTCITPSSPTCRCVCVILITRPAGAFSLGSIQISTTSREHSVRKFIHVTFMCAILRMTSRVFVCGTVTSRRDVVWPSTASRTLTCRSVYLM